MVLGDSLPWGEPPSSISKAKKRGSTPGGCCPVWDDQVFLSGIPVEPLVSRLSLFIEVVNQASGYPDQERSEKGDYQHPSQPCFELLSAGRSLPFPLRFPC